MGRLQEKFAALAKDRFFGIPTQCFESGGREQFVYLLKAGLEPGSKVVDLGCGVLRCGYWLIHFLNEGNYCGIEPHPERLDLGAHSILEPEIRELKKPRFDRNPGFDTAVFGDKFDFFIAYSIWTHASKSQIKTTLDAFIRDSNPGGVFLTTFLPANLFHGDYAGENWYGTSHESDKAGCIHHSYSWIKAECGSRGLSVTRL